jgi:tRNA-specific 2-thiouridylase
VPRAVALFSGGLDSALAIRWIQCRASTREPIDIEAVWVRVPCAIREARVVAAAARLELPLTILPTPGSYDELLLAAPRTGQGERPPCRDCRVTVFRAVRRYLDSSGGDFAISGEVLGQDTRTQRRRDLDMIAIGSGLDDRLVRPLSALRLSETRPERTGLVDRAALLDLHGEGRRSQLALAAELGIDTAHFSRAACTLCESTLAGHVQNLRRSKLPLASSIIAAMRLGRVEWLDERTVVIVSRRAEEADGLRQIVERREIAGSVLIELAEFAGPSALVIGQVDDRTISSARQLVLTRVHEPLPNDVRWQP